MATVSSPKPPRSTTSTPAGSRASASGQVSPGAGQGSSDHLIAARIAEAQSALWRAELSRSLLIPVMATMIGLVAWAVIDQWIWSPNRLIRTFVLIGGIAALVAWFIKRVVPLMSRQIQPEYAAYSLEHDLPELRHSLTSYVSLRDDQQREGVRGLVVRSIGVRAAGQLQSHQIEVPSEATGNLAWWIGVAGALALAAAYALFSPKDTLQSTKRLLLPLSSIQAPTRVRIEEVLPGNIEVLAGRPFEISAKVSGLTKRDEAVVEYGDDYSLRESLEPNTESGRYVAKVSVEGPSQYRIVAGDTIAGPFEITTRDVPVVAIEQVEITPPTYTKLPVRTSRGGAIVGEENAFARIDVRINRAIQKARIEFNPRATGEKVFATGGVLDAQIASDGTTCSAKFPLRLPSKASGAVTLESYRVRVWDSEGNENPDPVVYPIRIVADLVPEIAIVAPTAASTDVPINGAQKIEIHSVDPDYGLKKVDIQVRKGIDVVHSETVWSSVEGDKGSHDVTWVFVPQALGLRVDDIVQVSATAFDNRHDTEGKPAPNETTSDSVELKVVARDENAKLPPREGAEQANEQGDGQKSDSPDQGDSAQGENGQGEQGQGGQGGAGGSEGSESADGQSGNGTGGKPGEPGKNQDGMQESQDSSQTDTPSDGGSDASGDSKNPSGNGSGSKEPSSGKGSPSEGDAESDEQGEPGDNEGEQGREQGDAGSETTPNAKGGSDAAGGGKTAGKPQHDGDAFERIQDFLNEKNDSDGAKSKEPNPDGGRDADENLAKDPTKQPQGDGKAGGQSNAEQAPPNDDPNRSNDGSEGSGGAKPNDTPKPSDAPEPTKGVGGNPSGNDRESMKTDPASGDPAGNPGGSNDDKPNDAGSPSDENKPDQGKGGASEKPADEERQPTDASTDPKNPSQGKGSSDPSQSTNDSDANGDKPKPDDASKGQGKEGQGKEGQGKEGGADAGNQDAGGKPDPSRKPEGNQGKPAGDAQGNEGGDSEGTPPNGDQGTPSAGGSGTSPSADGSDKANSDNAQPMPGGAQQEGAPGDGANADAARPADPVDVEYARKATDMVLDYLNSQKETPDPELLERLDWTPEELRAFADRWSRIREGDAKSAGDQKQVEEALRSLGIRAKQDGAIGRRTDQDDTMRGLKDSGNRTPPPPIHRDAFDAFRRNANRQ